MQAINNVETKDAYDPALTIEDRDANLLAVTIANASVRAEFRAARGSTRDQSYGNEILLDPQRGPIPNVSGAKFRSAVPGQPARIIATLVGPSEPQISGGIAFAGTLLASGQVSMATPAQFAAEASGILGLTTAFQDVPGCSINFTVNGDNASALAIATWDMEASAVAGGTLILGQFNLDGNIVGVAAVSDFTGAAPVRATVANQHLFQPLAKGAHTLKLVAEKTAAGGAYNIDSQTTLSLILIDQ